MSLVLPVNIDDLLDGRGIESARIEFKGGWDAQTTAWQVLRTICAFANDLHNLNGGYIVIGVDEQGGQALRPVRGLEDGRIEAIQKWLRGQCRRIDPVYQPILSPERVDGRVILVVWAPGSDSRPHRCPESGKGPFRHWVRLGPETVDVERCGLLQQLLQLTARVPFDDRRASGARIEDLREGKVREFLHDIRSGLLEEKSARQLYRKMRIAVPVNGHDLPKNIGILMFAEDPEIWLPGARIEVVRFSTAAGGDTIEERIFRGGLHEQLRNALRHLEGLVGRTIVKQDHSFQAGSWVDYPLSAIREALVNAVYHRSYEADVPEPVKVFLYPDRLTVTSHPGPVPGLRPEHFRPQAPTPSVPARNRRIGEFLKDLGLAEGRGTGLPKLFQTMRDNGSPEPIVDFDADSRTYFTVTLPAHPNTRSAGIGP